MFTGRTKQFTFNDQIIASTLSENNKFVRLKAAIPWEKINKIYQECYPSKLGNATKRTELAIGLILLKKLCAATFRGLIAELHRNLEFMYFCNVSLEDIQDCQSKGKKLIDHSTLVKILHRLGPKRVERIEKAFTNSLKEKKQIKGRYLFVDTTSLEKNIIYPTEVSLVKRVIEHAEQVCQQVVKKKDLVKSTALKKANTLAKLYYSASRKTKELLKTTTTALITIAKERLVKAAQTVKNAGKELKKELLTCYKKVSTVGAQILEQTAKRLEDEKVEDKILSYYEEHVRALPKGKAGKSCEFGVKLRLNMSENQYITDYQVYVGNPSDATMTETAIKNHAAVFKEEFKAAACDRGFYNHEQNRKLENKYHIYLAIPHKKDRNQQLGKRRARLYNKRAAIEAKISEAKRMYGLDLCRYKGLAGDQICVSLAVFALNAAKYLRDTEAKTSRNKRSAYYGKL